MLKRWVQLSGLILGCLAFSAPVFATPTAPQNKTPVTTHKHPQKTEKKKPIHAAKAKSHSSAKVQTHQKLAQNKNVKAVKKAPLANTAHSTHKEIAYKNPHHAKAMSHAHKLIGTPQSNSQDYISQNQNFAANFSQINSSNQDMVSNGFNQQMKSRLLSYQNSVCANAEGQIGKPYQWGGEDPSDGFDCSGLSQFVYAQEGIQIPRTALEQYHSLQPVKHLQEGDLVFFRTHPHSRQVSHVGIYVGDGYFVHSPRTGENIRMSNLNNPYWKEHYAGARRVLTKHTVAKTVAEEFPPPPAEDGTQQPDEG